MLPAAKLVAVFSCFSIGSAHAAQTVFGHDDGTVSTRTLASLSTSQFTTFQHELFPHHSIRIKKADSDWCDPSVDKYTGWIDTTPARHLFFYFFESRNDSSRDPVILWTNGGPGSSSSLGLFAELGPCTIISPNETKVNPYSWNSNANIFFIDQPIDVGFSYADYGETVGSTEEGAKDIAAFVSIFFETFSQFKGREFHLSGESYGGRYLPVYASEIYDQNKILKAKDFEPINLKSVLIGNGYTDLNTMIPSYYDMLCTPASVSPIFDISTCIRMKTALPRVMKTIRESCINQFDRINCQAASAFSSAEIRGLVYQRNVNPYDVTKSCFRPTPCYDEQAWILEYLNLPEIQKILGVPPNTTYSAHSDLVSYLFNYGLDSIRVRTQYYLEGLLERGIDILIYVGSYDFVCNWVGNLAMVNELEWNGAKQFKEQELKAWSIEGGKNSSPAGRFKSYGKLTYTTIEGAGHLVPHDKPVEAQRMLVRWLSGQSLL